MLELHFAPLLLCIMSSDQYSGKDRHQQEISEAGNTRNLPKRAIPFLSGVSCMAFALIFFLVYMPELRGLFHVYRSFGRSDPVYSLWLFSFYYVFLFSP